jgi:hypothetical protein
MRKVLIVMAVLSLWPLSSVAEEITTFEIQIEGGSFIVSQDVPKYFFGDYQPITGSMDPGSLRLSKGRNPVSHEWRVSKDRLRKFIWGAVVKDGKIEKERITPANAAYKPYDRMRILVQYEDGALETMQAYRAVSEKYGQRIVVGRYLKTKK